MDAVKSLIFEEINKLNFPPDQYIVTGSGIMAAKGIREAHDLDMVVSIDLFETCKSEGWKTRSWTRFGTPGKEWLQKDSIELMQGILINGKLLDLPALIQGGENINGIWFLSFKQLIEFKKDYGRPKDFDDIALIERYLNKAAAQ